MSFLPGCSVCHAALMSVRPYPSQARALRQIMRRHRNEIAASLRAAQPGGQEAGEWMKAALAALPSAGAYVLSTRRAR
ncbi:hypothetical protein ACQEV9_18115 [Streptomyces chartreusis]|uniref:hypothetical protein n=1 Tax=Streptomyces chartreusis TaxID=1969 RepID=UPI003D93B856